MPTKQWSERTFFQLENTQHLAVAHSQNHAAGTPPPYWAYQRCMKNPVVTQLGSRCDNFTVHESHGLGVYPSTYYINPNNVHHHLDQGPRAIHVHSSFTSVWKQHCASGSVKWPFPVWRWSQIPAEERGGKKEVSLLSCGIAQLRQAAEALVLNVMTSLFVILISLRCHKCFCSYLSVHKQFKVCSNIFNQLN